MGLIDQLNYDYEYKTPLTKELLLNFADDLMNIWQKKCLLVPIKEKLVKL